MSDFLENEAEESDEYSSSGLDSDEDIVQKSKSKKKSGKDKKKSKARIVDDDEEEEEDDLDKIAEEMKDFINEDVEEEEEESDEGGEEGKRKRDSDLDDEDDDQMDDEDYDLIEENLGIKVKRQHKRKRIKMITDEEDSDQGEAGADVDGKQAIEDQLFEGAEEEFEEGPGATPVPKDQTEGNEFGDLDEEEESDIDDFIVDDDNKPISKGKKKRHVIHSDAALQEAQDIFGVDFDFDEFAAYEDEEDEEFEEEYEEEEEPTGEDGETRPRSKKTGRKRQSKRSIFEMFEPSELERGHFTQEDNEIRTADMPERFQLRQIPVRPTEEGELEEESDWIYKQAFSTRCVSSQTYIDQEQGSQFHFPGRRGPGMVTKIREAINFMRNQRLEVPFIAFYRKEYVEPELNINDLWKVWHWDEKWTQLCTRKKNLVRLFEKMQSYLCEHYMDPERGADASVRPVTEESIEAVKAVQTMEELRDVYQHFTLHYGADIPRMRNAEKQKRIEMGGEQAEDQEERQPESMIKQATRQSGYTICIQAKLDELARRFGLTPEQVGENLRDNYQRHEVDQCPVEPLELAKDYICGQFPTEEAVLMGARHIVAMQIAHDPLVRQCVRQAYAERAKIKVIPTKKGLKETDESHSIYPMKYLKNKPVSDLKDDQFLKLQQAEEDGHVTISIGIDVEGSGVTTYFEEVRQLYYRDEFSHLVQQWNIQRSEALNRALTKILYPQMEKELRNKLIQEAKEGVIKACCRKLYNWLKVAPYQADQQLDDDYDYDESSSGLRVLGMAFTTSKDVPTFGALVGGDGEVTDYLRLPNMTKRRNAWRQMDREDKEKDLEKLKDFIASKKPHVVAVSAESRDALMIIDDVKAIIGDLEQEHQMAPINVELVDNELAVVYENSNKAQAEFRDYPPVLRHAVSIARRLQDPLIEFAQLCNADDDIMCLKYHTYQDLLPKDDLQNALYLEFVNRVNEVGVDINRAIAHSHTASLVQFVCGLGPRKGSNLTKVLKQNNSRLENRTQLVSLCHMGPKVFINCAGFIKIDTNSMGDSTENYVDVLDGSRVHPEAYEWARKMAVDALEYDDTAEDANPAGALEEILESPERLKDLDLDAFAEELERQGYGDKHITLYDIRAELNHRYKDLRTPYRSPTNEERFNMITKETPETFFVGKLVLSRVYGIAHKRPQGEQLDQANPVRNEETGLWQCPFCNKNDFPELSEVWSHFDAGNCPGAAVGVKVRLDNGVTGFIPTKMISDKKVTNPEERVQNGMTIHSRITKIDIDRFQVELTCRSSDLMDKEGTWRPQKDLYYDFDQEKSDTKTEEDKKKQKARQTYIKRVIAHPCFHNISYQECEKLMVNMDQGDVIIRPSSKGADHLTATWKVCDGILHHIDVREEGKENAFSLGRSLWVNGEEFEDLDEIIARHIQPMAAFVRDILNYKHYKDSQGGKREILDKKLYEEKKKSPSTIPYLFSASKQYPGKFLLSYLPRTKTQHEYASVTPEGIKYRLQIFRSLNSLIRWFKEHFRDPIPGTPASTRTPMVSSTFATPSINLQGVDPATIQRAAAGLPSNIYNTLAQVANATPQFNSGRGYAGAYSGGYNYQPVATPLMTPLMTPSYHTSQLTTPAQQPVATPSYQPTPRSGIWPGATPHTPAARTPAAARTPRPTTSNTATDWAKAAEMWAKQKQSSNRKPTTPRSHSPSASPNEDSSPAGDATPLIDER